MSSLSRDLRSDADAATPKSSAFTPGPWIADESEIYVEHVDMVLGPVLIAETRPLPGDHFPTGFGPSELANACLISAAPDLLEATRLCMDWIIELAESGDAGFWDAEKAPVVIAARAAIAKALGTSPSVSESTDGQTGPGLNQNPTPPERDAQ